MKTLIGIAMNPDGFSSTRDLDERGHLRTRGWSTPTSELRYRQASRVPIDVCHDGNWRGDVIYLERSKSGQLWAAGHADVDPPEWMLPLFWSVSVTAYEDGTDVELQSLAVGLSRRAHGLPPLTILEGKVDHRGVAERWGWRDHLNSSERELLKRAAAYHLDRPRGTPLVVHDAGLDQRDLDRLGANERHVALTLAADNVVDGAWMHQKLRIRPGRVLDVR